MVKELESGYQWLPSEGEPLDIPYEKAKLTEFWRLYKEDDFSTDEQLMDAYRVFVPKGFVSHE